MRNVLEYLEFSALTNPDGVAFVDEHSQITFQTLQKRAQGLGSYIRQTLGLSNAPIGVTIDRSVDSIVAMQGVLYSGNYYVPMDATMPIKRAQQVAACIQGVVYQPKAQKFAQSLEVPAIAQEDHQNHPIDAPLLAQARQEILDIDPVYMMFTSGSTGVPKGIVVSHSSVIDFTQWMTDFCGYDSSDIFGNQAPFYFDLSVKDLYQTLKLGATCYIFPKKYFTFPKLLLEAMAEGKITAINWATSAFQLVANANLLPTHPLPHLRKAALGGEALQAKDVNHWKSAVPGLHVINLYGPTEITVDCTGYHVDRPFADQEVIPIGKACQNKQILLLSPEGKLVDKGETGELCVRGRGLAKGYFGDWEKTKNAFVQNPLQPHYPDLIYKTGDLAYENERGEYVFVSRFDGQIKHMGYRIELPEIETALLALPTMKQAVCLFDEKKDAILAIYAGEGTPHEIAKELRLALPKYMLPNQYHCQESLPLNANGKVDRVALKEVYLS